MHHYVESGLNQVWLRNGYVEEITAYGPLITFTNIASLHDAIAVSVVDRVGKLKAEHVRFLRRHLNASRKRLADQLGVAEKQLSLWEDGRRPIARDAEKLLRIVVKGHLSPRATIREAINALRHIDIEDGEPTLEFMASGETWRAIPGVPG